MRGGGGKRKLSMVHKKSTHMNESTFRMLLLNVDVWYWWTQGRRAPSTIAHIFFISLLKHFFVNQKALIQHCIPAFWLHNNLCKFTALKHKFKSYFVIKNLFKTFVLKISVIMLYTNKSKMMMYTASNLCPYCTTLNNGTKR